MKTPVHFIMDVKQMEAIGIWWGDHWKKCHEGVSEQHSIKYIFWPGSIGSAEFAECSCGEKIDVTDYDKW